MDLEASKAFLRCLGVTHFDSKRSGWVTCACPLGSWKHTDGSGKASFGLKLGTGRVMWNCFSCDCHGSPLDLVYEMRFLNKQTPSGKTFELAKALAIIEQNPSALLDADNKSPDELTFGGSKEFIFPEDWLAEFELAYCAKPADGPNSGEVHPYLASRDMPYEVARALDLRYDNMRSRVCFPVRDHHNRLRGLHGRSIYPHVDLRYLMYTMPEPHNPGVKHCNPDVWLGEAWVDPDVPVVVVESVFDLARVYQVYRNVMCPLMASLNAAKIKRLAGIKTIVTMFDADKAGSHASDKLTSQLKGVTFFPVVLPAGYKDPSMLQVDAVATLLQPIVPLDPLLLCNPQ